MRNFFKTIEIKLDDDIFEALEEIANDEEKSVNNLISEIVKEFVIDDCVP